MKKTIDYIVYKCYNINIIKNKYIYKINIFKNKKGVDSMPLRFRLFRYIARHTTNDYIAEWCFYFAHKNTDYIHPSLVKRPQLLKRK